MKRKKIIKKLWTTTWLSNDLMVDVDTEMAYKPVTIDGEATPAYYDGFADGVNAAVCLLEDSYDEIVIPGSGR